MGYPRQRPDGVIAVWSATEISGDFGADHQAMVTDDLVVVRGDVLPGAKIESSADVVVMGDLHDADIAAGGTIEVRGDILPGDEPVVAGEGVAAGGHCKRAVIAGSLRIGGTMHACQVRVTGDVDADVVIGGSVVCGGNLRCREAGNSQGIATELWAGHQPSLTEQQRICHLAERRMEVEREELLAHTSAGASTACRGGKATATNYQRGLHQRRGSGPNRARSA